MAGIEATGHERHHYDANREQDSFRTIKQMWFGVEKPRQVMTKLTGTGDHTGSSIATCPSSRSD